MSTCLVNVYLSSLQFMLFSHQTLDSFFIFYVQSLLLQNQRIKVKRIVVIKAEKKNNIAPSTPTLGMIKLNKQATLIYAA